MSSKVLVGRLILKYLKPVKSNKELVRRGKGVEPIHQVRVYARRVRDTFRNFEAVLPQNNIDRYNEQLRKVGRDLGPARDLDIHILFLRNYKESVKKKLERQAVLMLIKDLTNERRCLQPNLARSIRNFNRSGVCVEIEKLARILIRRAGGRKDYPVEQVARACVKRRILKLFNYARYVHRPGCVDQLHQMRIEAKHLRYALEGLQLHYGKPIDSFIADVVKIQRALGEVHDFDVWLALLPEFKERYQGNKNYLSVLNRLENKCQKDRKGAYDRFVRIWREHQRKRLWNRLEQFFRNP